eukprot:CAMPEP_0183455532 /NCGR_PEP_ID=MMETSP0370-20130417/126862_1 /TAXON_ID=268820 /ORGANISM="Peridinium aciculiferum, Strain PAER-2" /LENGTH=58 /DNA_ID=CAMNT_0025647127 /DNA_START=40 /DNA_END=213 /DNA_ORIENTATION=-
MTGSSVDAVPNTDLQRQVCLYLRTMREGLSSCLRARMCIRLHARSTVKLPRRDVHRLS